MTTKEQAFEQELQHNKSREMLYSKQSVTYKGLGKFASMNSYIY